MTLPRSALVSLEATPYYHCIGRCVRRAFLCGIDRRTGISYEHRRDWIRAQLALLTDVFAIDVCAYAVMSNHYHLVLKCNSSVATSWSLDEVLLRWCRLYAGPVLIQRYRAGESLDAAQLAAVAELVEVYRERLVSLSWFMKCLNEPIARQANAEDNCTGHFWEGRFTSQALLDEQALIACMAYVDLNPVRAGMAATPEQSDFTSIQQRIQQPATIPIDPAHYGLPFDKLAEQERLEQLLPKLLGFAGHANAESGIPFALDDYLQLVDWSGRAIDPRKRGKIADTAPPILQRLGIDANQLLVYLSGKNKPFKKVIGRAESIRLAAIELERQFLVGIQSAKTLFPKPG